MENLNGKPVQLFAKNFEILKNAVIIEKHYFFKNSKFFQILMERVVLV